MKKSNSFQEMAKAACSPSFAAFVAVLLVTSSTVWATPPTPVLHYSFDDGPGTVNAADTGVAPAANGIFNGSATRTVVTPTGSGYALDLSTSGGSDYVYNHDNPAKLNGMSNITMTCWVNLQANQNTSDRLISKFSTTAGFDFRFNNATANSAQLIFELNTNSGSSASASANINALNQWVFVAVTYNGSGTSSSQVNFYSGLTNVSVSQLGTAQTITVARGPGIVDTTNDFRVGSTAASTSDRTPPAWFDDVQVFNTVLSQSDLEAVRLENGSLPLLQITTQPFSKATYESSNVTFTVAANQTATYQWYVNGTNVGNLIVNATNSTLALTAVTTNMNGNIYACLVGNALTNMWSSTATLTVVPLSSYGAPRPVLLDFGPTTVANSSDAQLSLGHYSGAVPSSDISWNQIQNADVTSGLTFSDGLAAPGVSVIIGRCDAGVSNMVDYANKNITSSALGGSKNTGIYANTSPMKDGIYNGPTGTTTFTNSVGFRMDGLAAGTYTLYIAGRNTSSANTAPMRFFATHGVSATTFAFDPSTTPYADEANNSATSSANITYGDNCATALVITLGSGDSLFFAVTGSSTNEPRGFLNCVEIVPGLPVLTNFPVTINAQPGSATVYAGYNVALAGTYSGPAPLYYQWYSNNVAISGATSGSLTLSNVAAGMSGSYYNVIVTNQYNSVAVSSNATLTVVPVFSTGLLSNIWNILPGQQFYVDATDGGERSLAYDAATTNLLLMSHIPTNNIVVLDPATGTNLYFMNLQSIAAGAGGLNMIAVADDGVVYGANVVADANSLDGTGNYNLWQWADDGSNTVPVNLFSGDPGYYISSSPEPDLRFGDNLTVRGAGANTQILIAPGRDTNSYGANVILFTTPDGLNFNGENIAVSGVPSGFAQFGLAFGPGTNTFWAKTTNAPLYLIQFDMNSQTGAVLYAFGASNGVPNTFVYSGVNTNQTWLAGIMNMPSGVPGNIRLYDITNLTVGPVLADQEINLTTNGTAFLGGTGTGSIAFGDGNLYTLFGNNGIRAFAINTNLAPFRITSIVTGGSSVVLTWVSVAGHSYQVQVKGALTAANWSNVGSAIMATGSSTSATNGISGATQFYRVQGN
jgi:hypothetical protein